MYQERVSSRPVMDIPALTVAPALATYFAAKPAISGLVSAAGAFGGPAIQEQISEYMAPGGDWRKGRRRLVALAALAGLSYGVYKHGDFKGNMQDFIQSMTKPGYWDRPEVQAKYAPPPPPMNQQQAEQDLIRMDKQAFGSDEGYSSYPYYNDVIPVHFAVETIRRDPFLLQSNRTIVSGIVGDSGGRGNTSGFDITTAALKAGASFVPAYLLGQGLGNILAMPAPLVNRMSKIGGVAAAVIGSGVLKQIR